MAGRDPFGAAGGLNGGGDLQQAGSSQWIRDSSGEPLIDLVQLEESTMGDTGFGRRLVGTFVRQTEDLLAGMAEAASARDSEKVRTLAHRLKGAAAAMGAVHLHLQAEQLEEEAGRGDLDAALTRLVPVVTLYVEVSVALERYFAEAVQ